MLSYICHYFLASTSGNSVRTPRVLLCHIPWSDLHFKHTKEANNSKHDFRQTRDFVKSEFLNIFILDQAVVPILPWCYQVLQ